ncbi:MULTISPECIES: glycosyltransferase [unclassified Afipia]|uniref:glycosyltransferase n=1 Tax=unclassified Afipia TaxID=2642050 RepID=UPI0003FA0B86
MTFDTTWLVVPAFNEEAVVGDTVAAARQYFSNIIVVDDCSSDKTQSTPEMPVRPSAGIR